MLPKLAAYNKVDVRFFKANLFDYRPDAEYDIIFSSGGTPHKHCMDTLIAQKAERGVYV